MMRWDDLRVFLAVFEGGSLMQAATRLGINVSTVARRLDALEESLGLHLFDRTPEGTSPTAAAERMLPYVEQMAQAAASTRAALEGLEMEVAGTVRITAAPGVADHFLAPALPELRAKYPRLRLELLSTIDYADLSRREADLALRIQRPTAGDLVSVRLATEYGILVAAPAYARTLGRLGRRSMGDAAWVTWGPDLEHRADFRFISDHVPASSIALRTSSMTAQVQAVRAGLGIMIATPAFAGLEGLCKVATTSALAKEIRELGRSELWLVGHRALRNVPRIAAVWEWIRGHTLFVDGSVDGSAKT